MQTRDDIFNTLRDALVELFELEPERVSLDANLYQDLEIDSIDAVDLIDHIKRQTGKKIAAEEFKSVRTVNDVVEAVYRLVNRPHEPIDRPRPAAGGAAVPFAVYYGMEHFAPWQFGLLLGSLWLARALTGAPPRQPVDGPGGDRVLPAAGAVRQPAPAALVPGADQRFMLALFGLSLKYGPPMVERLARCASRNCRPRRCYTRQVTVAWSVFFSATACSPPP
jgi:acyl carrier protein